MFAEKLRGSRTMFAEACGEFCNIQLACQVTLLRSFELR